MPRTILHLILLALVTGCVTSTRPDDATCALPRIRIEVTVAADRLTPADIGVCRDQEVTLVVASEVDGFLHIHGYEAVATRAIRAGETAELVFTVNRSGQFPIEIHPDADPAAASRLGVLTVHEP